MKTSVAILIAFLSIGTISSKSVVAQTTWNADPMHSKLSFSTNHMGISEIDGFFNKFEASTTSSKPDFSDAVFELTVDVASINTLVEMRDKHLRSADFFEVEKFPRMTYKSTGISKVGENKYQLTGDLTLRGITKPVTMDLWYRGSITDEKTKGKIAGFQLTGTIKRSDFGIGPKFPPPMISDEVKIKADGEFKQKQ